MSQPVVYDQRHVWVSDTAVYTVPLYRIAGIYAPANAEFATRPFALPASGIKSLWLNADASWHGDLVTGVSATSDSALQVLACQLVILCGARANLFASSLCHCRSLP